MFQVVTAFLDSTPNQIYREVYPNGSQFPLLPGSGATLSMLPGALTGPIRLRLGLLEPLQEGSMRIK